MSLVSRRTAGPSSVGVVSRRAPLPTRSGKVVAGARKVLLQQDFSDWPGSLKNATLSEANNELWEEWGETSLVYGVDASNGRLKLGWNRAEVRFSKDVVGLKNGGAGMKVELDDSAEKATMSYEFRFSKDFDWTLGGKLPGLCSDAKPDGCRSDVPGWSNRLMWRTYTSDGDNPEQARISSYRYYPGKTQNCGDNAFWRYPDDYSVKSLRGQPVMIESGKPYRIAFWIKLNSVGRNGPNEDGEQHGWLDDGSGWKLVFKQTDMIYRDDNDQVIDTMHWHVYHGGSGSQWTPNQNQSVWFKDFLIREGYGPPGWSAYD